MSNLIRKVRLEKAAICNAKTKTTIVVQHLGVRITMVVSLTEFLKYTMFRPIMFRSDRNKGQIA